MIDRADLEMVSGFKWHFSKNNGAICNVKIEGKRTTMAMHRLLMNPSKEFEIDHINHNRLDNRRSNLRICTRSENNMNKNTPISNKVGIKNVSWDKQMKSWRVRIIVKYKTVFQKLFKNLDEAIKSRNENILIYHKNFGRRING